MLRKLQELGLGGLAGLSHGAGRGLGGDEAGLEFRTTRLGDANEVGVEASPFRLVLLGKGSQSRLQRSAAGLGGLAGLDCGCALSFELLPTGLLKAKLRLESAEGL
ncbi:MAG: hypothetical protein L0177_18055, partial [Chloroflexi bacterium]|nr:hypothetical protein [Chloroflexota bacterium]